MTDPKAQLAAFTVPGQAEAINNQIDDGCQAGRRDGSHGEVPRRPAAGEAGTLRLPAADGDPLHQPRDRTWPRPNTCSRSRRSSNARRTRCSKKIGHDAGLLGDHQGRKVVAGTARRHAHRPAEHRPARRRSPSTGCSRTRGTSSTSCSATAPSRTAPRRRTNLYDESCPPNNT